jgi:hypothetical protein
MWKYKKILKKLWLHVIWVAAKVKKKEKKEVYLYWISDVNCILIKTWCYTMWYGVDLINYFIKVLNTILRKKHDPKKNCGNLINYYVNKIIEMLSLI